MKEINAQLKISKTFSSTRHPQANYKVEAVNKTIKRNIRKKIQEKKDWWAEELPFMTTRNATGETLFFLTCLIKVVVPIETEIPD